MKIVSLILISLLVSGCVGTGFNKRATLMPDSVGIETDIDPNEIEVKTVEVRASWNIR